METQEIYERKLFSKAPPRRGKDHAYVLSTHSFHRGSALISFSVLLQSGLHQNGQSVGKVFAIFSEHHRDIRAPIELSKDRDTVG